MHQRRQPLGYKRLGKSGINELKAPSYRAFLSAMKSDNEVKRFYLNPLQRTLDRTHVRLNTQRKILSVYVNGKNTTPHCHVDPLS